MQYFQYPWRIDRNSTFNGIVTPPPPPHHPVKINMKLSQGRQTFGVTSRIVIKHQFKKQHTAS